MATSEFKTGRRVVGADVVNAFEDLYNGMLDANENGTGYSPKVADAMQRLKVLMEVAPRCSFRAKLATA